MKSYHLGKMKNLRKVPEAKESDGKSRKVSTEATTKAKTPDDLDLAIADMIRNRQPYNAIAQKLRVSPRTISKVAKMMNDGTIKIGADGKAMCHKNAEFIEIGPLTTQLQMEILGAAHLEGKSPQDLIAGLIRLDRRMRLKELTLDQLERVAEFLEKAYSRGWTNDPLIDILTRLENSGFSGLNQELLDLLREFLEKAKSRNLKPEHIIRVSQRTEDDWRRIIQEGQEIGYKDGIKHHADWLIDLAGKTYDNLSLLQTLCKLSDLAGQKAMDDFRS
jgi:hypothetical protein